MKEDLFTSPKSTFRRKIRHIQDIRHPYSTPSTVYFLGVVLSLWGSWDTGHLPTSDLLSGSCFPLGSTPRGMVCSGQVQCWVVDTILRLWLNVHLGLVAQAALAVRTVRGSHSLAGKWAAESAFVQISLDWIHWGPRMVWLLIFFPLC